MLWHRSSNQRTPPEEFLKLSVGELQSWITILDGGSHQEGRPTWPQDCLADARIPSGSNMETSSWRTRLLSATSKECSFRGFAQVEHHLKKLLFSWEKATWSLMNGIQFQTGESSYSCFLFTDALSPLPQAFRGMLGALKFFLTMSNKKIPH